MAQTFGITLNQVLMMFIFLLIGYFAKKGKLLNDSAGGVISNLLVWVFLPAMCFNTFATQFNITSLFKNINFVIIGAFVMIFEIALGFLWAKLMTKDKFERGVYAYTVMFPNYTYFGYPLIWRFTARNGSIMQCVYACRQHCVLRSGILHSRSDKNKAFVQITFKSAYRGNGSGNCVRNIRHKTAQSYVNGGAECAKLYGAYVYDFGRLRFVVASAQKSVHKRESLSHSVCENGVYTFLHGACALSFGI